MTIVLLIAAAIVVIGTVGIRYVPVQLQSIAAWILIAAILIVVGCLLWTQIEPLEPVSKTIAIVLVVIAVGYGVVRFKETLDERRP